MFPPPQTLCTFAYYGADMVQGFLGEISIESSDSQPKNDDNYCPHYKRSSCNIQFKCCKQDMFFPCHKCHNELIEKQNASGNVDHDFDENTKASDLYEHPQASCFDAVCFKCTHCETLFDSRELSEKCINCKTKLASYVCVKCRLLVNADKSLDPYHCDDCGTCRENKSKNFHCSKCNICLNKKMKNNHKCLENSGRDTCGVCMEDVFPGCKVLPCSHKLHRQCLESLLKHGMINCPSCRQCFIPDNTNDESSGVKKMLNFLCKLPSMLHP